MKILWICNTMLPIVAEQLGYPATNKEGWLSGLSQVILKNQECNQIELAVAAPLSEEQYYFKKKMVFDIGEMTSYGFLEDVSRPEYYDEKLTERLLAITEDFQPDVIHCFGTEYPHTCAICEGYPDKSKLLVGIQGLCSVYANTYFAQLPKRVVNRVTFRDWLKKDSMVQQQNKFVKRGETEIRAVKAAGNVTGRTAWDAHYTKEWNKKAAYHFMNETLRSNFYEGIWTRDNAEPYSIFLSQGDYPIKGLHYMLLAMPEILKEYPEAKVYVAGNSICRHETMKDKIKLSSYGKYILEIIKEYKLEKHIAFLGRLDANRMKEQYLKSSLFVCCSTIENSPNSLGEAMLLGMPCVTSDAGGVLSIFRDGEDGIAYPGFRTEKNSYDVPFIAQGDSLDLHVHRLAQAVMTMWSDEQKQQKYCENARAHALVTHDGEANYQRLMEIYKKIMESK